MRYFYYFRQRTFRSNEGKICFFFFYIYTDNFWHYLVILTPRPKKKNSRLDLKFLLLFMMCRAFGNSTLGGVARFFFRPSARPFVGRSGAPSFMHLQVSIPKWSRLSRKKNFGQKKKLVDHKKKEEEKIVSRSWRSIGASTSLTESFLFFTTAANEKHCRLLLAAG